MPRPKLPENERKSQLVQIRLTKDEKRVLVTKARIAKETISDLIRRVVINQSSA